jgi:hypothetical protein
MATVSIASNDGPQVSASAVLELTATNPAYNQPALRINQAGQRGGAASIRIDDPNPDIEFIETEQAPLRENMKLPFSLTNSRSLAATQVIPASRPLSCFSGERRVATSVLEPPANLAQGAA